MLLIVVERALLAVELLGLLRAEQLEGVLHSKILEGCDHAKCAQRHVSCSRGKFARALMFMSILHRFCRPYIRVDRLRLLQRAAIEMLSGP